MPAESVDVERQNARYFMNSLAALLPSLTSLRSSIQVDEAFQDFASKYCLSMFVCKLTWTKNDFNH